MIYIVARDTYSSQASNTQADKQFDEVHRHEESNLNDSSENLHKSKATKGSGVRPKKRELTKLEE